ncbi:MAG TPA: hypothetical protein VLI90_11885 [Tepidisphaeraceae bacterium]|nr:hypothetical protein [Tepidisphaeraceae bacterium]
MSSVVAALKHVQDIPLGFSDTYPKMIGKLRTTNLPATVCRVDDAVPGFGAAELKSKSDWSWRR